MLTYALWYACHGSQRSAAEYVLARGGDINWISFWDHSTPLDAAQREGNDDVAAWVRANGGKTAAELDASHPGLMVRRPGVWCPGAVRRAVVTLS